MAFDLKGEIARATPELIELRRDLHRHPELSFQEHRTAALLAERLRAYGLEVRTGVGGTGVVAVLRGKAGGKTIALRADMDALPVTEVSTPAYRSETPGTMHACGHDGHTAAVLTVAKVLALHRDAFAGAVKFIFQPAEETANGAEAMIEAGALDNPRIDGVLAAHLWNYLPVGTVGLRPGPLWASADELRITVKGRGGHGAMPHQTIDPMPVAAHIVLALQHLQTRETSPFEPVVLTFGAIQGGTAFNVIPSEVRLIGTLRVYDIKLRDSLVRRAEEIVANICRAFRAEYAFEAKYLCPPVVNDAGMTSLVRSVMEKSPGRHVITADQSTTGDDVAYFHLKAPGCYILVGSGNPARGLDKPHHHPQFDFDEGALPVVVEVLAASALEFLNRS